MKLEMECTMKTIILLTLLAILVFPQNSSMEKYYLLPISKLSFDGTSTLHDYTCEADVIFAGLSAADNFISLKNLDDKVLSLAIKIPVKDISSGDESMDENMDEAFNAESYSNVHYRFIKGKIAQSSEEKGAYEIKAEGELKVSGKSKIINMDVRTYKDDKGNIHFTGSKKIDMTDFGIEPPSMMFGVLKTGKDVTINYHLIFSKVKP